MKQFRPTIIIFAVFVMFIGYYFLIEKRKPEKPEEKKIYIYNFNKEDFKTLEIVNMFDKSSILLKKDKEWMIEKPEEIPASRNTVDGIISELAVLQAERDITKAGQRLKQHGLDIPKYKIIFGLGNETHTLMIGIKSPTEEFYFVKKEDSENIYTVKTASIDKIIRKDINDLRDKEFLCIREDMVKKVEMDMTDKGRLILEKGKENKWAVQGAEKKDLNNEINNFFEELNNITVEEFVRKGQFNAKDYGLDKPSYQLNISRLQDEAVYYFGKMENNLVYVNRNKENAFFKVRRNIVDSIDNLYANMKGKPDIIVVEPKKEKKNYNGVKKYGH